VENGRPLDGGPVPLEPTFASIQQNVFTPICTSCHAGAAAPTGLRLDEASSYAMLVNVASVEVPSLRRVQPGNPDLSYLIQKLEGSATVGGRMPLNSPPLPQTTIDVIRQWISQGAQRSAATTGPQTPATITAVDPVVDQILEQPPREILLSSEAALDTSAIHSGSVILMRSGGDGSFAEGNEVPVVPTNFEVRSLEPTVIAVQLAPNQWTPDSYRLSVAGAGSTAIADRSGSAIDGDRDGRAGGDFVMHFEIGRPL
jgi:hypothetical protein